MSSFAFVDADIHFLSLADTAVAQIKTHDEFKEQCIDKKILCFVAFLGLEPEFPESVEQNKNEIEILQKAKLKHKNKSSSFHVVWVNALETGRQLMRDADVSDILPGFLAIHTHRGFYTNFRAGFDQENIEKFISDVLYGRTRNVPISFDVSLDKKIVRDEL